MKKYKNLISELDEKHLEMIAKELPEFTNDNLGNIKNKFKEQTKMKTKKEDKRLKKVIVRSLGVAASICIVFVGLVNTNTVFAAKLLDIPVLSDLTHFVTIDKLALEDKYRQINIEIPSIEGIQDTKVQEEINNILRERGIVVYDKACKEADKIKEKSEEAGFLTSMPVDVSQNYFLVRNNEEIMSFKVVTTEIGASAYETVDFYNIDLKNSKLLNLSDLFIENYDYNKDINDEIIRIMKERVKNEDAAYFIDDFKTINENTNFYINEENKLVLVFNEGEIAASFEGMPEFIIDTSIFKNNISSLGYLK
ncbi:MAG: RsiV family protein [Vallitalea sp.]|jgi:hypothetical protein|nr:RsiV family protein [Vallitalea sp.]